MRLTGSTRGRRRDASRLPEHLCEARDRDGGTYNFERDVLVARHEQADTATQQLRRQGVRVRAEAVEGLDVVRLRIIRSRRRTVPQIIEALKDSGRGPLTVAPNYVLGACTHASAIPVTTPRPAPPRPALHEQPDLPGEGVRVGVLDTGATDHPYFAGRCEFRPEDEDLADADGDGHLDVAAGHGTFIAGLILQHAPRATVVARRMHHEDGPAPRPSCTTDLGLAADLVAHPELYEADVLTLSLGGYTHDGTGLLATEVALRTCVARNPELVVVAGAGNDARTEPFFPAAFPFVVGVGALDASAHAPACFSNRGWWVDAGAVGVQVHSTFLEWDGKMAGRSDEPPSACDGRLADAPAGNVQFDRWAHWDGTSFSAPRVAAAIAARISTGRSGAEAVRDVVHAPETARVPGLGAVVNPASHP